MRITEKSITKLLANKHAKDVFIPQCKDGPSWMGEGMGIMDAWAMPKSWAKLKFTAYEIKTSRSDFLGDDKWNRYLKNCNCFYFVCPYGMITKEEVPDCAGLMYVTKTGKRLITKKKAPYRDTIVNKAVLVYILMHRAKIVAPGVMYNLYENDRQYWDNWLSKNTEDRNYGHFLSKAISKTIKKDILDVQAENLRLKYEIEKRDLIKEIIESVGLDLSKMNKYTSKNLLCQAFKTQGDTQELEKYYRMIKTIRYDVEILDTKISKDLKVIQEEKHGK